MTNNTQASQQVPSGMGTITSIEEWKAKYLPEQYRESLTLAQAMEFLTLGLQSAKQVAALSKGIAHE